MLPLGPLGPFPLPQDWKGWASSASSSVSGWGLSWWNAAHWPVSRFVPLGLLPPFLWAIVDNALSHFFPSKLQPFSAFAYYVSCLLCVFHPFVPVAVVFSFFKKDFIHFIFRQRGREGEKEGEKHQCVVASRTPPTGDLACNPDWESNGRPLVHRPALNPHQPGMFLWLSWNISIYFILSCYCLGISL